VSRLLSLVVVLVYVAVGGAVAGPVVGLKILAAMLLPLACIWFPDALGEYTGQGMSRVTAPSPPSLVWLLGWTLLFLPVIVGTLVWLQGVPFEDLL